MESVQKNAYAKINLTLDVLGKRQDGYHDIKSVMQSIDLHDTITVSIDGTPGIKVQTDQMAVPRGEENIVYKAAMKFFEHFGLKKGINIRLVKKIPMAAGMAGGSADAAATLLAMNELFKTNADLETLQKIGALIGADVPFCITMGTALAEGIGEKVTKLPDAPMLYCVAVKPDKDIETKYAYTRLDSCALLVHPDNDAMISALHEGNTQKVLNSIGNVFESVIQTESAAIMQVRDMMLNYGASKAMMTGSGPTIIGFFEEENAAREAAGRFKFGANGDRTFLSKFYFPE